ncbi:hypothetical protein [Xanthomonas sp. NCPPB 2632]|uniref:hypothetical protein n=1 Tax=Xanthomonas sp. NCPPB 2632 TaxID=3240912 RepID=UPI003513D2E2
MHNVFRLALVSFLSVSIVGCASMPGGGNPDRPALSSETKAAALKGCGVGAVIGAAVGFAKGGGMNALKFGAAGCATGAVVKGALAYRAQLKETRQLADAAKAQGLNPVVTTKDVTPLDSTTPEPALERLVLPLDAKDTASHGKQTAALLTKAATIASADTAGQHITITLAGSKQAREWMRSVMSPLVGNAGSFVEVEATTPRIELSPVPTVAAAPASNPDARIGKGAH